jgi:antitoxin HicB
MDVNPSIGSALDAFPREEGILESTRLTAVKEVIACQLDQAMREEQVNRTQIAVGVVRPVTTR